ncbi:MAG: phospholipid carrier-dependent glycosyltransferase [Candidatus Nealsonbacteria bacterium]
MLKIKNVNLLLIIFIFLISFFVRIYRLQETEIYPDEITWMVRGKESFLAIKTGRFFYFKTAWWKSETDTEAINLPGALISGASMFFLAKNQPTNYSLNIFSDYIAARIPFTVINSLFIVFFYLFLIKITNNKKTAFLGSLIFSLDPISIALSRWYLVDSYLMIWLFLSFCSFYLIKNKKLSIITTALFLTLSFLTKPTALILLPVLFMISPSKLVLTLIPFFLFVHIFWLGNDGYVGLEIYDYVIKQYKLSQEPFQTFFAGKITTNPPIYYYLYQLITRLPFLTLIGFFISLFTKKVRVILRKQKVIIPLSFFVFLYILVFSLSTKKLGIRYIYPIYPWIYYVSSVGIIYFYNKFNSKLKILCTTLLFGYLSFLSIYFFPNYYLFYNQIFGGPTKMQSYDMVGLCTGAKNAISFINKNYLTDSVAYLGCNRFAINYYSGVRVSSDWKSEKYIIIEESLRTLSPENEAIKYFFDKEAVFINKQQGVILSRVYIN